MAFQAWEALTRDGVAGRLTRAELLSASARAPRTSGPGAGHRGARGSPCSTITHFLSAPSLLQRETGIPDSHRRLPGVPQGTQLLVVAYRVWPPYASYFKRRDRASCLVHRLSGSHLPRPLPDLRSGSGVCLRVREARHAGGGLLMRGAIRPKELEPRFSPVPNHSANSARTWA